MRLKKIKLAGFKSFVDPTSIPFPGDMTAIVGPNGCGKSNVIDAVRWVLGESSAKNLRGDAMTDVIFNGSSARKPVGQCSVELVFDNSAGRLGGEYARFNELSVKRLVTRDATSTYFLNGTKCRRRDVTDLFLGTGLGPRSYAIIEQGMISRLIESKPQELRVFIEEAAGISKYKERRRETENRIRHTQDNLERLEDVRGELGQQLEKLQRQAATAARYKTLKTRIRELKSQLAALRWLTNSEHITKLEQTQAKEQQELDALVAQQRGDEAGIHRYREQQQAAKASLDALQQELFTTATAITRLEQNTLHGKQRHQQLIEERNQLTEQQALLEASLKDAREICQRADQELQHIVPQSELMEAQLEQAVEQREEAEQALRAFSSESREKEQKYQSLKQEAQHCHSKIQSTTSMQLRTTQRLSELDDELGMLRQDDLDARIEQLDAALDEARMALDEAQEALSESQQQARAAKDKVTAADNARQQMTGTCQRLQSTIAALEALQDEAARQDVEVEGVRPVWQSLDVEAGAEALFEFVLGAMQQPLISESLSLHELASQSETLPKGKKIWGTLATSSAKPAGTLAVYINQADYPALFDDILVCDTLAGALDKHASLSAGQSIVTRDNLWLGKDFVLAGEPDGREGALQRAARLSTLTQELDEAQARLAALEDETEQATQQLYDAEQRMEQCREAREHASVQCQQLDSQRNMLDMQREQARSRLQKLIEERERQKALLDTEHAQLESLSEQLETLEEAILDYETHMKAVEQQREQAEQRVASARTTVEQLVEKKHSLDLTRKQQENQLQLYQQQVARNEQQLHDYRARDARLKEEQESLLSPLETQQEELQILLERKQEIEERKSECQAELDHVDALLREAEQGQAGIASKISQRQTVIEKLKIDIEGFRVRAAAVLEQLEDTGVGLKAVLESLPEDASEDTWQAELEKNQAAIDRLGAVNLAAVEEFEIQSQRKAHLDEQHNDLVSALDTLEAAIRKIDKETRTRFSATFEQVNNDLKTLFPKVFGGGSAYLDLTDDDLLETGVTIMARPPGKKNSTIHLLSGGEKALTALSLVFAIFRLNPAPFCLLDEVDAPLDDANVGRFCKLVSEMSQTVQFIYITHNKIAMEMASHLTGVTMAEPGVSRMVAVDVEEAMAFAEA
ncbi:chromosome segregation protein SMC [Alteromonas sp. CYL-A6]|uniref:chromosome segregation protein SMC n=1 Tax=Alteromonas nitratireducens TaxID=3390813 RepID=UPI0034AEC316